MSRRNADPVLLRGCEGLSRRLSSDLSGSCALHGWPVWRHRLAAGGKQTPKPLGASRHARKRGRMGPRLVWALSEDGGLRSEGTPIGWREGMAVTWRPLDRPPYR